MIENLANAMPSATSGYLDDAGHLPFLDDSNWVAGQVHPGAPVAGLDEP